VIGWAPLGHAAQTLPGSGQQSNAKGSGDTCIGDGSGFASATQRLQSSHRPWLAILLGGCQKRITRHGVAASMRAKANCYDNSKVETFFKTITAELIWRTRWETRCQAEGAIFQHINGPYNPRHHQSSLGGKSPLAFERKAA